jgi:malate/lactate dehydrogenase
MRVGIVGTGTVGATAGYALMMRGGRSQNVLVDNNNTRFMREPIQSDGPI